MGSTATGRRRRVSPNAGGMAAVADLLVDRITNKS